MEKIPSLKILENSVEFQIFCDKVLDLAYIPSEEELLDDYQYDGDLFFLIRRENVNYIVFKDN